MDISYYDLSDDRQLGVCVFEIVFFPATTQYGKDHIENCEWMAEQFVCLLTEVHKLINKNICLELLWITEKLQNQIFTSRIRIFNVIRIIGDDRTQISYELSNLKRELIISLSAMRYGIQEEMKSDEELHELLDTIDNSCTYSVIKSEKCVGNANSIYPYYFSDVIPNKNSINFDALIAAMSQYERCCISFQLFPTCFTNQEVTLINEVAGELDRISSGIVINREIYRDTLALDPLKAYTYYNERKNSPLFLYNILVFGEKSCCASLAARLISLMQSGKEKIVSCNPMCLDLTNERINIQKQFPYYVWNINTRLMYHYRNKQLQKMHPLAQTLFRLPCILSVEEAASFYRLPLYEKSMVALKSNQAVQTQEQFSNVVVNENNIQIGRLLTNDSTKVVIGCPEKAFTKHALIVGTPGSGKTTFSVNLLLQFARRGIPFLAIEPTKSEYRAMIDAIPGLRIFTPGNNSISPYIINPFIPPKGIRVEQYIPSLASAFKAAFSMPSPLDMIFLKAIRSCYIKYGWKDYSMLGDNDVQLFGLYEFILVFKQLMAQTNYSKDARGNIESAGLLRLTNLIEQNSNIYDTINTVPIEDLLTAPTVLELNSIDNAEQKSLIMALLLINICIYTKHNHIGDGELKNVILIDEAHVLLGQNTSNGEEGKADSQATTIKALQDMIAEIRSYGTSIIIADQSPTKVSRAVVANTDIKVSFRLVQSVEKELIADSTNMDENAQAGLSRLRPGEAYVYYSQMNTPQIVITEDIREKEGIRLSVPDSEVAERSTYWSAHKELLKPYKECKLCSYCKDTCDFRLRSNAEFIANSAFTIYQDRIKTDSDFSRFIFILPKLLEKEFSKYPDFNIFQMQICSRIKLMRKIVLERPLKIENENMRKAITEFPK